MEALMKAINDILKEKDTTISNLKWEIEYLKIKVKELENDIEKYKENEVNINE